MIYLALFIVIWVILFFTGIETSEDDKAWEYIGAITAMSTMFWLFVWSVVYILVWLGGV